MVPGEAVDQVVAIDQPDRCTAVVHHWQHLDFRIGLEALVDLVVGRQGRNRGDVLEQVARRGHAAAGAGVGEHHDLPGGQGRQGRFLRLGGGCGGGAGDEVTLTAGDTQVADGGEVGLPLDAFGDDEGAAGFGDVVHRAHQLEFEGVVGDAVDEVPVDLDELGAQLGPHAQVGKAFTEVVDGDAVAQAPVVQQGIAQGGKVVDLLVLGDFDDDAARGQAQTAQQVHGGAVAKARVAQGGGAGIDEQPPGQLQGSKRFEDRFPAGPLQFEQLVRFLGGGKQLGWRLEQGPLGAADQAFEAQVGPAAQVKNGLEHRAQLLLFQDAGERLVQRGGGGLCHIDVGAGNQGEVRRVGVGHVGFSS